MRLIWFILLFAVGMNILMFNLSQNLLGQISAAYNQTINMRFYLSAHSEIQRSLALLSVGLSTGKQVFVNEAQKVFRQTTEGFNAKSTQDDQIHEIKNELNGILSFMETQGNQFTQRDLIGLLDKLENVSEKISFLENASWKAQLKSSEELLRHYEQLNLIINALAITITLVLSTLSFFLYRKYKLEKIISKENEIRSSLFTSLAEAIFVTDSKGNVISCNQASIRMTGLDSRQLVSTHIKSFLGNFKLENAIGITPTSLDLVNLIQQGKSHTGLRMHTHLNRQEKWYSLNIQPVFYQQDSNNFSMILSFTDITEQILSHQQIKEQQERIVENSRSDLIAQMAGGIAHEITNPLTIISSSMELLEMKAKQHDVMDTLVVQKSTSKVIDTVNRIGKIVNGMLALSRKSQVTFEKVEIGKVILTATDFSRILLEKNKITLKLDEKNFDLTTECYHIQISQVLINLIKNATEAVAGLEERWIEIEVIKEDQGILINITDSGAGMNDELRERIMLPFFTSKKIGEGTGLGLSISRTIIENHQGKLHVSKNSKNTQFNVYLPYKIKKVA